MNKKTKFLIFSQFSIVVAIVTPIVVLNNKKTESNNDKKEDLIKKIKDKILTKNLLIKETVPTSNNRQILEAIKKELKKMNPNLTNDDLAKITSNVTTLISGIEKNIILIISSKNKKDTISINVTKKQTANEIYIDITSIKNIISKIKPPKITILETSGTIDSNKDSILKKLQESIGYPKNLKGVTVSIESFQTQITPEGVSFNVLLDKAGSSQQKISSYFLVKRTKTQTEINDFNFVKTIKDKIQIKNIVFPKDFQFKDMPQFTQLIHTLLKNANSNLTSIDLSYTIIAHPTQNNTLNMIIKKGTQKDQIVITYTQGT